MYNFIICDDNQRDLKRLNTMIEKYMFKSDLKYEVLSFSDYDDDFLKIVSRKMPGKIYILDIEAPTRSGIDIARIIRRRDYNSALIFVTAHEELGQIILKKHFRFLAFINKFDEFEKNFTETLDEAVTALEQKQIVRFSDGSNIVTLEHNDIVYITRDSVERKTVINYGENEVKVNIPLSRLKKMLTDDFIETHRSCIVNKKRIISYNKNQKVIKFDNGDTTDLISSKFKGELI